MNMLFPTQALQRCCREVLPFSAYLRKYSERVQGCSAAHGGQALELDRALGFSSDTCYPAMGILAHLVGSLPLSKDCCSNSHATQSQERSSAHSLTF